MTGTCKDAIDLSAAEMVRLLCHPALTSSVRPQLLDAVLKLPSSELAAEQELETSSLAALIVRCSTSRLYRLVMGATEKPAAAGDPPSAQTAASSDQVRRAQSEVVAAAGTAPSSSAGAVLAVVGRPAHEEIRHQFATPGRMDWQHSEAGRLSTVAVKREAGTGSSYFFAARGLGESPGSGGVAAGALRITNTPELDCVDGALVLKVRGLHHNAMQELRFQANFSCSLGKVDSQPEHQAQILDLDEPQRLVDSAPPTLALGPAGS